MAAYDPYDAPYERERRYDDRPRYETRPRERESERLKPYPTASRDLVRHRDSDLSVEEVNRDFPPPGYRDSRRTRSAEPGYEQDYRSRHAKGPGSVYYQEEEARRKRVLSKQEKILAAFAGAAVALGGKEAYDRYEANQEGHDVERNYLHSAALGAAGALAGYQGAGFYNKHAGKEEKRTHAVYQGRDGRYEYYSDDDADSPVKKGHKKFLESVLGVTSMGAAMKALTGGDDKSSRRGRSRSSSRSSRSRGQSRSKLQKAAMASLIAGATEAFRIAKEPGGWKGEKAKRVVTAAVGAGALGGAHSEGHSKKDIFESVLGGLMGNRVLHGSKSNIEADDRDPRRSRSRSRARSSSRGGGGGGGGTGLAALATAGLTALTAKKALDTRDRSRSRSHRRDSYSDGSRSPSRRRRSRSRSVVDGARRSLAKLGIGGGPKDEDDSDHENSRYGSSRRRQHTDNDYDDDHRGSSRREKSRDRGSYHDDRDDRSYRGSRSKGSRSDAASETDLGDTDEDEKRHKKLKGKQILTTGLAAVATIHASHEVYESMERRKARKKAVREGRLSVKDAKMLKTKAILQDAASVGVAALGIKGAVTEFKHARQLQQQCKEFREEKKLRHERRLERLKRANSLPRRRADNWSTPNSPRPDRYDSDYGDDDGYYTDGNPYAATPPAPSVGYDRR